MTKRVLILTDPEIDRLIEWHHWAKAYSDGELGGEVDERDDELLAKIEQVRGPT